MMRNIPLTFSHSQSKMSTCSKSTNLFLTLHLYESNSWQVVLYMYSFGLIFVPSFYCTLSTLLLLFISSLTHWRPCWPLSSSLSIHPPSSSVSVVSQTHSSYGPWGISGLCYILPFKQPTALHNMHTFFLSLFSSYVYFYSLKQNRLLCSN